MVPFIALTGGFVAMIPSSFPRPALLVTLTGVLELAGAVGLLFAPVAPYAAIGLALLMIAMFPANVSAARRGLTLAGKPVTPLLSPHSPSSALHRRRPRSGRVTPLATSSGTEQGRRMTTEHTADIDYIDHTVLITTDLAATCARYEALGFTLSPVSPHRLAERPRGSAPAHLYSQPVRLLRAVVHRTARHRRSRRSRPLGRP
ncbi:hypothetical protein ACFSTC_10365 [Nonomuraea ferruginea]